MQTFVIVAKAVIIWKHASTLPSTRNKSRAVIIPERTVNFLLNKIQEQKSR
jgi:hypothetical protein